MSNQRIPTIEEAIWITYDDINATELLADIEAWLGCPADFPGFSPAALDEAQTMNAYDLVNGERVLCADTDSDDDDDDGDKGDPPVYTDETKDDHDNTTREAEETLGK